jgi:hypothetical protein
MMILEKPSNPSTVVQTLTKLMHMYETSSANTVGRQKTFERGNIWRDWKSEQEKFFLPLSRDLISKVLGAVTGNDLHIGLLTCELDWGSLFACGGQDWEPGKVIVESVDVQTYCDDLFGNMQLRMIIEAIWRRWYQITTRYTVESVLSSFITFLYESSHEMPAHLGLCKALF